MAPKRHIVSTPVRVPVDVRARQAVQSLEAYQPGKPIEDVQRELGLRSVVKLASNENPLGPSPKAVAALRAGVSDVHRYPDAACTELKARLARHLKVEPSQLCVGNGSDELLVLALRAFVDPGDDVVVAEPTFLIYAIQAKAVGARVIAVPLKGLRYDLAAMRRAVTPQTKLIFIANPDNPTGTYATAKELDAFLDGLPPEAIVVLDEAYYEFVEAKDYPQSLSYLDRAPVLITRSFSKAYGLAGLRIGYGISQPSVIRALDAVREPFNVNRLAQSAAAAALDDAAFLRRTRQVTAAGRAYLERELVRLGLRTVPTVTNFLLIEMGPKAPDVAAQLLRQGVIVRDMRAWKLDTYLRVTIGTMPENKRFIGALKQCLSR